jgi:hypothetical protein
MEEMIRLFLDFMQTVIHFITRWQRAMKPSFIIRFSIAALLTSVGCLLLMLGPSFHGPAMCFSLATLFSMPRSELLNPIPRRELWIMLGVLVFS